MSRIALSLAVFGTLQGTLSSAGSNWKFEEAYPHHYLNLKLASNETLTIDGHLDDDAWAHAVWTEDFVDISFHDNTSLNNVPRAFQTRVKMRWDSTYLYIGAELTEPFLWGNITGHNIVAPYHDNDFEVFIDVSGTTQYYKEFEMNILNATYDINWGVPDGLHLNCVDNDTLASSLPVCVNTSFPGYTGNWTMYDYSGATHNGDRSGMVTATAFDREAFGRFSGTGERNETTSVWTAEIAFPIASNWEESASGRHGGLLDTSWSQDHSPSNYSRFDPNNGDAGSGRPVYWRIDFARAEHPRRYNLTNEDFVFCPLDCPSSLDSSTPVSLTNPTAAECHAASQEFPTILGTDPFFGCYWEWVWQDLGPEVYMHRPTRWSMVQFVDRSSSSRQSVCKSIEWPGRYVARMIFEAEHAFAGINSRYTADLEQLATEKYCSMPACNLTDLHEVLQQPDTFEIGIEVNESKAVRYQASVRVNVPDVRGEYAGYTIAVDDNLLMTAVHDDGVAPCL